MFSQAVTNVGIILGSWAIQKTGWIWPMGCSWLPSGLDELTDLELESFRDNRGSFSLISCDSVISLLQGSSTLRRARSKAKGMGYSNYLIIVNTHWLPMYRSHRSWKVETPREVMIQGGYNCTGIILKAQAKRYFPGWLVSRWYDTQIL